MCDCGPFVIEPVSVDNANPNITIREHKVTYEPQVHYCFHSIFMLMIISVDYGPYLCITFYPLVKDVFLFVNDI